MFPAGHTFTFLPQIITFTIFIWTFSKHENQIVYTEWVNKKSIHFLNYSGFFTKAFLFTYFQTYFLGIYPSAFFDTSLMANVSCMTAQKTNNEWGAIGLVPTKHIEKTLNKNVGRNVIFKWQEPIKSCENWQKI